MSEEVSKQSSGDSRQLIAQYASRAVNEASIQSLSDIEACLCYAREVLCVKAESCILEMEHVHDLLKQATCRLMQDHAKSTIVVRVALCWCRTAGRLEKFDTAIIAANAVLKIKPYHSVAMVYKGFSFMKIKKYVEALLILEQAQSLLGMNPPKQAIHGHRVEDCITYCCLAIGRDPPLPPLIKFPRTAHLFHPNQSNAITSDDEVLKKDNSMMKLMCSEETNNVIVEEKIDGANIGFSLTADGRSILVQNRSHYIFSGEHAQFSKLAAFIETHKESLMQVLDAPSKRSSRHGWILFGEWLVARHSISYHRLPGYFVAFDLYDIASKRFVSRKRLHTMLSGSGIPVAPVIVTKIKVLLSPKNFEMELMRLLETQSRFRNDDGPVEGVVFRIDKGDWLLHRSKLVRPDFVAGCSAGHWSKRSIEKQQINFDFAKLYMKECYQTASKERILIHNAMESVENRKAYQPQSSTGMDHTGAENRTEDRRGIHQLVTIPEHVYWLWKGEVAVSSTPRSAQQVKALHNAMNIGLILSLAHENPLPSEWFSSLQCENYAQPIVQYMSPTLYQMDAIGDDIVRAVISGQAVLQHCNDDMVRVDIVAACLLLRFGSDGIQARLRAENTNTNLGGRSLFARPPFMTCEQAIKKIRGKHPGSINVEQQAFIFQYEQHLCQRAAAEHTVLQENMIEIRTIEEAGKKGNHASIQSSCGKKNRPKYIILMGLPGSRKSSFGHFLTQNDGSINRSSKWVHANQDDMGRRACEDYVGRMGASISQGKVGGIVVDCCNVTATDRAKWIKILHQPQQENTALVFLDSSVDACILRVHARVDHPKIPFGRGDPIIRGFAKQLQPPTAKEQNVVFGRVEIVQSRMEALSLLQKWGASIDD